MTQFSRVEFFSNAAIIFCAGLALFLLLSSLRKGAPGPRLGRVAIVPLLLGAGLTAAIVLLARSRFAPLLAAIADGSFSAHFPALAVPFALAVGGLGALLGELALIVFPERVAKGWEKRGTGPISSSNMGTSLSLGGQDQDSSPLGARRPRDQRRRIPR